MRKIELFIEAVIFQSRWILAPFYLGLAFSLLLLLYHFLAQLAAFVLKVPFATESDVILGVLGLIDLAFTGDRIGGLAPSLLPHALERFAMQSGITLHLSASGIDDHHVAEAAFKALAQALRQACAPDGDGVRSTKGLA